MATAAGSLAGRPVDPMVQGMAAAFDGLRPRLVRPSLGRRVAEMATTRVDHARTTAEAALRELPTRWRHTVGVAGRAAELAVTMAPADRDLLVAAAWLHDIGYGAALVDSGFHPLDGARFLDRQGWSARLCGLVAHHSAAWFVAREVGLEPELARFPWESSPVSEALAYADQTTGPDGRRMPIRHRIAEAVQRHGTDSPQARARVRRQSFLLAVAARVERRLLLTVGRAS
jgi:hypothetical protein